MASEPTRTDAQLVKRRFIAGAVCPSCREEDRLRVDYYRVGAEELQERHCVACGFSDDSAEVERSAASLPRIRRGRQSGEAEAQPVRLLDPKAGIATDRDKKV